MISFPCRVVVVDDLSEEAKPLLATLKNQGTPALYFQGGPKDLPPKPLQGIRILFLDLRLAGMEGQPIKTVIAALIGVVRRLVSERNGPYVIIAWTKHPEDLEEITAALYELPMRPLLIVPMTKAECRPGPGSGYDLKIIQEKLAASIVEIGAAGLFLRWEELVREAAGDVAFEVCSIPGSIPDHLATLFYKLAKASVGDEVDTLDPTNLAREALFAMSGMLADTVERTICDAQGLVLNKPAEMNAGTISDAALNAKLLTSSHIVGSHRPGMIFATCEQNAAEHLRILLELNMQPQALKGANDRRAELAAPQAKGAQLSAAAITAEDKRKQLLEAHEALLQVNKLVSLVVTPYCDYGQKKALRPKVCSAVFWPERYLSCLQKKSEFLYITPVLRLSYPAPEDYRLVVDLRTITGCSEASLANPVLALRRELVLDIQSRLGHQISRPGVTSMPKE
jgi:hypothetical protein